MKYDCFSDDNLNDLDSYFIQVRPTVYFNSDSLSKRMINQGCNLSEDQVKCCLKSLKSTVKSILVEGGMVTIDDFISFVPSISCRPVKGSINKIDKNKISLSVKASVPLSFSESIAMEAELNGNIDVENKKSE